MRVEIIGGARLHLGDCIEAMRGMSDASIDSIVTDPPYELGFMGRAWDASGIANNVQMWAEALRVLKPGGHLLAFSGSRTYHRMVCAIEDAGFEIRDQIMWVYGSGFPKSLDVSKAIDKAGGVSPKEQAKVLHEARMRSGMFMHQVAEKIGCTGASIRDWEQGRARTAGGPIEYITPSPEYRKKLADLLGYTEDERRVTGATIDRREDGSVIGLGHTGKQYSTHAATDAARQWKGWGTALKPAHEPIVVARKPLVGTVAANVLAHGTGAINIDGSRVPSGQDHADKCASVVGLDSNRTGDVYGAWTGERADSFSPLGRWPANFIHDGSAAVLSEFPVDASRFFYVAKASKEDRGEGNTHPTVKPTDLMRHLVRMVTPAAGVVLDPFMGSGSTGKACVLEGFRFVGIDMHAEHVEIAKSRIAQASGQRQIFTAQEAA